jgi:hypothetical protein
MKMKPNPRRLFKALLLCVILFTAASTTRAQTGNSVQISLPDHSAYPVIRFYLDPFDRSGSPLENLQLDQITLVEDGLPRDILEIQTLNPGIQLVTAFNFSSSFAIQDIIGRTRFEYIQESLLNWVAQPIDTAEDDLSILDSLGLEEVHSISKADWIGALEEMGPVTRESVPDLNVLSRAIEIASDPVSQPGMKRVVLFFSSQLSTDEFETIDSLISLAKDNQVRVYTILVSSPANFDTAGASKLQTLSTETGGKFLTFSGEEPLADLGQLLYPLRTTYMLKYESSIITRGIHTLEVSISATPSDIVGSQEFTLDIQPPNPIFITPPRTVTRTPIEETLEGDGEISFEPTELTLPILIEFPDNHPRELEEVIFRVDGEIIETKTSPPFDQFIWTLDEYQSSGTHYLTLEAVDLMGLSRISVDTPIEIEVIQPPLELWDIAKRNGPALLGLALILLFSLTLFVFISRGRIRPGNHRAITWTKNLGKRVITLIKNAFLSKKRMQSDLGLSNSIPYRLIPVNDISQQLFPEPIQIDQPEITLGNSNLKSGIRINHPSITPNHARISSEGGKIHQITDLGSVAGTWINYQEIPPSSPHVLKDGDIINIGEAAFRFQTNTEQNSLAANKEK